MNIQVFGTKNCKDKDTLALINSNASVSDLRS